MTTEIQVPKAVSMSMDIEATDKEKLQSVFPQCFTEGKLDIDKLLSLCGEYIDNDFEKYKFEWKGKSECYRIAGKRSTGTLRPAPAESVNFEDTNNLYIEGDNLEVLKLLQTAYYRKVKMIYIDPPYNTGNDFVYEDDFKDPMAKYKEITSQTTKSNPETMGRYHTNWLNMMYPRLRLAANLLRDDGVIFISIDDNEVVNLRRICDEVFGEENFITQLVWEKKKKGSFLSNSITNIKEYIIVYCKNFSNFQGLIGEINNEEETYPCINAVNKREIRQIPAGIISKYKEKDYFLKSGSIISDTTMNIVLHSDLIIKDGKLSNDLVIEGNWRYSQDSMADYATKGELYITRDLYLRRIVGDTRYKTLKDLLPRTGEKSDNNYNEKINLNNLFSQGWGSNEDADEELRLLLGTQKLLDYPKPTRLLIKLLAAYRDTKDSIILDFFSGSATTAHAVMQLNAEDGGNRQFIMVQLPELTNEKEEAFKAGYKNICEIGKERIRRAGKKILSSLISSPLRGEDKGEGDKQNLLNLAQNMRHNPTESENKLWQALRNNQLDCKFRRQHQIGNYIVDFVCLEKKLIVECDGGQHNENVDAKRTEFLDQEGFRVLRFWNNEVLKNLDGVLMRIKEVVDNNTLTPTLSPQGRGSNIDIGFKVFKLDTSNLVKWDDTPLDSTETSDLFNRLNGMEKSLKKDRTELDVVYEVMAKLGIPLTYKISELNINNRKVYSIGEDGLILVCLDSSNGGITPEDITAMCELAPAKIIAAEEAFKDDVSLSNAYYISKDSGVAIELL